MFTVSDAVSGVQGRPHDDASKDQMPADGHVCDVVSLSQPSQGPTFGVEATSLSHLLVGQVKLTSLDAKSLQDGVTVVR